MNDLIVECSEQAWVNSQIKNAAWYKQTYPWLPAFPISQNDLKNYYVSTQQKNNRAVNANTLNCYASLWSYYLTNAAPGGQGQTSLPPTGAGNEGGILPFGAGNIFNISTGDWLLILLAIAAYYFFTKD